VRSGEVGFVDIVAVVEDANVGYGCIGVVDLDAIFGIANDGDGPLGEIGIVGVALEVHDAEELLVGYPVRVDEVRSCIYAAPPTSDSQQCTVLPLSSTVTVFNM
jgi:hypothetical protein